MKRRSKVLFAVGGLALSMVAAGAAAAPDGRPVAPPNGTPFGVYDPGGDFKDDSTPAIEHLFLPWEDIDLSTLAAADAYARAHNRVVLITVEPWSWDKTKHVTSADLLAGIKSGKYDGNITALCTAIGKMQQPVTIRWAQEMEDTTTGRFTWAGWAPRDYIAAYRRVVTLCRPLAPAAKYMWSPMGLTGLDAYYPGDDVVDSIGLSVFGLQKYDDDKFGHDRTFAEILKPGYGLVTKFNKPIYVAELGYRGDAAYVQQWAHTVLEKDPQFPDLVGVVYFDDMEVFPWIRGYGLPDWKVKENTVTP